MSENIISSVPSGSDLEGSAQPADSTAGRSDPTGVPVVIPVPKKSPVLLFIALVLLSLVSVLAIYLFLQVRTLSLEQTSPSPTPTPVASADPTATWETYFDSKYQFSFKYPNKYNINRSDRVEGDGVNYYFEPDNKLIIIVEESFKKNQVLDSKENGTNTLGENTWTFIHKNKSLLEKGANDSSYALQLAIDDILVSFIQPNDPMLTDDGFNILSTFKFTD